MKTQRRHRERSARKAATVVADLGGVASTIEVARELGIDRITAKRWLLWAAERDMVFEGENRTSGADQRCTAWMVE